VHVSDSWMSIADRSPDPLPVTPKHCGPVVAKADIRACSPVTHHKAKVTVLHSYDVPCLFDVGSTFRNVDGVLEVGGAILRAYLLGPVWHGVCARMFGTCEVHPPVPRASRSCIAERWIVLIPLFLSHWVCHGTVDSTSHAATR
jgi:hypothetical protein